MTEYIVIASTLLFAKPEVLAGCVEGLLRILLSLQREAKVIVLPMAKQLQIRRRKRTRPPKSKRPRARKVTAQG